MKQRISFAQMVGITIKSYHLEQLVEQQPHMGIFQARSTRNEQIRQLRLFTLPEETPAQERLILLGQIQLEMSRVAALRHPIIQPILEYGREQEMTYLVTKPIPVQCALESVLSTEGPLDMVETGHHLKRLASALEYAHKHAIAHGNLTASNVFLRPSSDDSQDLPSVLLTDVGIAHLTTLLVLPRQTRRTGRLKGAEKVRGRAPAASPESTTLATLGQPIESMTDIAALGALLYQMLTAHTVFADGQQQSRGQSQIVPINVWSPDLPAQLDDVVNTACMGRTYRSPSALVDAYYRAITPKEGIVGTGKQRQGTGEMQRIGQGQGTGQMQKIGQVQGSVPVATSPEPTGKSFQTVERVANVKTRRTLLLALTATGAGLVAAGAGWFFLQSQRGSHGAPGPTSVGSGQQTPTPSQGSPTNGAVIAHTTDLPINNAKTFSIPNNEHPGVLIHLSDERFVAFDTTCTHQGCQVDYNSTTKQLECPCHGAVFDPARDAAVVVGPAPTPLASIKILVNADGTITRE